MSGFGRTGNWFGVDKHGVVPDMIATAKGITAGYLPLGALIVSDTIAKYFDDKVQQFICLVSLYLISLIRFV